MSSIFCCICVCVLIQGLRGGRLTPALFGLLVFAVVAFSESGRLRFATISVCCLWRHRYVVIK